MIGSGSLSDAAQTSFDFAVRSTNSGPDGRLLDHEGVHTFTASSIRALAIHDRTATFTGTGTWDGLAGYTFTVRATDASRRDSETHDRPAMRVEGRDRRGSDARDRFAITIRSPLGVSVFSTDAALSSGDIAIYRNGRADETATADSAGTADWADRAAPRLRAIVGGRAIAE